MWEGYGSDDRQLMIRVNLKEQLDFRRRGTSYVDQRQSRGLNGGMLRSEDGRVVLYEYRKVFAAHAVKSTAEFHGSLTLGQVQPRSFWGLTDHHVR